MFDIEGEALLNSIICALSPLVNSIWDTTFFFQFNFDVLNYLKSLYNNLHNAECRISLKIPRFVHVADDALNRDVADRLAEEKLFDRWSGDGTKGRQKEEEATETELLGRVGSWNVAAKSELSLVLKIDGGRDIS